MTTVTCFRMTRSDSNMRCGPHREGAPALDFLAIHSRTKLPLHTSTKFNRQEPKSDDMYKLPMTRSD